MFAAIREIRKVRVSKKERKRHAISLGLSSAQFQPGQSRFLRPCPRSWILSTCPGFSRIQKYLCKIAMFDDLLQEKTKFQDFDPMSIAF